MKIFTKFLSIIIFFYTSYISLNFTNLNYSQKKFRYKNIVKNIENSSINNNNFIKNIHISFIGFFLGFIINIYPVNSYITINNEELLDKINHSSIRVVKIQYNLLSANIIDYNKNIYTIYLLPNEKYLDNFINILHKKRIKFYIQTRKEYQNITEFILDNIGFLFLLIYYFIILFDTINLFNNFKHINKSYLVKNKNNIFFKDIAGYNEIKKNLFDILDYQKYILNNKDLGIRNLKGILFYGYPGTGKTLFAQALSNESNYNFFYISGSEIEDKFIGLGASKIRNLFIEAKQLEPSIIFIDELDSIGKKRNYNNDQTLIQLLTEMDGFNTNNNIIVIGATNRLESLDNALLRRFDRKIEFTVPDLNDRIEILQLKMKNKDIFSKVNLNKIAELTKKFTPADINNLINETLIKMIKLNKNYIEDEDIISLYNKIKKSTPKNINKIIGETIITFILETDNIIQIDINSISKIKLNDKIENKEYLINKITVLLGGLIFDKIESKEDYIENKDIFIEINKITKKIITTEGLSEKIGFRYIDNYNLVSNYLKNEIEIEYNNIYNKQYLLAFSLINKNLNICYLLRDKLKICKNLNENKLIQFFLKNKLVK